jgi:hypothetical protein
MAERVASLLHFYRLRASQTKRLQARSDLHDGAHVRMHPEDIEALARPADSLRTMVALFSTASASEAVCLRSAETVYVRPGKKAGKKADKKADKKTDTQARKKTGKKADTEVDQQTEPQTDQQPEHSAEWVPLRVSASHAYVRGMRVSGTVHRAVLRLVRE